MGGWAGGQSCLPSAIMALNEVNLNASILPKYRIILNWFNSEVSRCEKIRLDKVGKYFHLNIFFYNFKVQPRQRYKQPVRNDFP